jgi:hypothetical protein
MIGKLPHCERFTVGPDERAPLFWYVGAHRCQCWENE